MNTKIDSNFGPRAQAYFKAADAQSTSLYNANGTVNKDSLAGVKGDLPKLPQGSPKPPKKQASIPTQDTVAFSSEARGSEKASSLASSFAAAWG